MIRRLALLTVAVAALTGIAWWSVVQNDDDAPLRICPPGQVRIGCMQATPKGFEQ